jgi:hypothetical protein
MIDREAVLAAIAAPMQRYRQKMTRDISDWQPLEDAAAHLLQGKDVPDEELHPDFRPLMKMMRLIRDLTRESAWDWAHPEVQKTFLEVAGGQIFTLFSDTLVDLLTAILESIPVGTVVEAGTGPGKVTARLCAEMARRDVRDVRLIVSDQLPAVSRIADGLRSSFPSLSIADVVWNIREQAGPELTSLLKPPVLLFERFCLPYAGHAAIDNLSAIADILLLVDDLSLTGQKASFDYLYEKIGTQFLVFESARQHLEKFFSRVHVCDMETVTATRSPVTTFTLAIK